MSEIEVFDAKVLAQISPFSVRWEETSTVKKTSKAGGIYEKKVVVVENPSLREALSVEVTREQYERMRVLSYQGIKTLSATEGVADAKGYRRLIISGAPVVARSD